VTVISTANDAVVKDIVLAPVADTASNRTARRSSASAATDPATSR